jgi:hypothetical protein
MWLYKEGEEYIDNSGGWVGVEEGAGASCAKNPNSLAASNVNTGYGQYAQWYTIR